MRGLSIRLTHKILAIGVVGLLGVLLVGGIHFYGESAVAIYRLAAEKARAISELNRKVEVELLEGRRAEKDFLLRNDPKKAERQVEIGKAVAADIAALHDRIAAIGAADLAARIEAMRASLGQYQDHFEAVVALKQKLGLNEDAGLEGRLRGSVHAIEAKVDQLHEPALLVTMLMMRRHEKDFMLRRDAKYGGEMKKRAAEFTAGVEGADIPAAAKPELKRVAWRLSARFPGVDGHRIDARGRAEGNVGRVLRGRACDRSRVEIRQRDPRRG